MYGIETPEAQARRAPAHPLRLRRGVRHRAQPLLRPGRHRPAAHGLRRGRPDARLPEHPRHAPVRRADRRRTRPAPASTGCSTSSPRRSRVAELAEKVRHAGGDIGIDVHGRQRPEPPLRGRGALLQPGAHEAAVARPRSPRCSRENLIESTLGVIQRYRDRVIPDVIAPSTAVAARAAVGQPASYGRAPADPASLPTGLVAALVFAALTINAYRQGKFGNGDLLAAAGRVRRCRSSSSRSSRRSLQWVLRRALVPQGRRAPHPGRDRARGRHPVPVRVRARRPRREVAPRPHPADREPRARAVPGHGPARAVRRRRRGGHPGLQRGREHRPRARRRSRRRCAATPLHAIVVDDGSADDTTERARAAGAAAVRLPLNRGQGAALRTGYRLALATGAEIVVTMDADGQHQPSELSRLVAADRRGRGRRRRRLARAGRRRPLARRPRDGHQALRPACSRCSPGAGSPTPRAATGRCARRACAGSSSARTSSTTPSSSSRRRRSTCARSRCR